MRQIIPFFAAFLLSINLWAQPETPPPSKTEAVDNGTQFLIENLVEDSGDESFDFDTQFEYLEHYQNNPLDLNTATEQELTDFGLLSAIQIQSLLLYRERYGQIYSLYELQGVPTFDVRTIIRLSPYIAVSATKTEEKFNLGKSLKYSRHQIFARYQRLLEQQRGFRPLAPGETGTRFLGSPDKLYFRYRMTYKDRMSLGVTMENDAGEEFFTGSNPQGFDYYSAHLYFKNLSKNVHSVALGDYQVFFGQGLTIWGGFGIRKGAQVLNIKRISLPIRPYTSVNEALFMRGAAAHFQFLKENRLEATVFGSFRERDANLQAPVDTLDLDENLPTNISSLQTIGFHRTPNEIADENAIGMITTGARLRYKSNSWHLAGNMVYTYLTNPLVRSNSALYQRYQFSGRESVNASLDYSLRYRNLQFFGETAINERLGVATLNGLIAELDPRVSVALLHRYYDRSYNTLHGNAFGEGTQVNNESGFYAGLEARLGKGVRFSTYFDVFQFPWLRFQTDAPTGGYEVFSKLDYAPNYRLSGYLQYRFERRGRNMRENTSKIDQVINHDRQNLRLHFSYNVSSQLGLRSRIELSTYQDNSFRTGLMVYQDLVITPRILPNFKAQIRLAFFETPDFDTRIFVYENDVLYAFSVVPYFGQGLRYYFNLSYKINKTFSVWLRFAQTYFTDRDKISSGLLEIDGSTRSDIKIQIRAKF